MEKIKRYKVFYQDNRKPVYIYAYSILYNGENYIAELKHKDVVEFKLILGGDIKKVVEV